MISHKYKYIFIHIPKNAGTSIEHSLLDLEGIKRHKKLHKMPGLILSQYHLDPTRHQAHALLSEFNSKIREEYFSFTFVRNPFDRVVSEYKWDPKFKDTDFLDFLKKQKNWRPRHNLTQLAFINEDINFIGKFENLQEDFNTICDKIGIPRQQLPHKNATKHKHYTEYYDDKTREIVADIYAKDIEYFGYKFKE